MQLDYIDKINAYGEDIIRLYDFEMKDAIAFQKLIQQTIVIEKKTLDISSVHFIKSRNCTLTLCISDTDEGITTTDKKSFFCNLTLNGYKQMVDLIEPFTKKETKGYQFLYDIDIETDFLFSPGGTW